MKKYALIAIFLTAVLSAQENHLIEIKPYPWMKVSYTGVATVFNTTCDKLPYEDPFYYAQGDTTGFIKVMEYVANHEDGELYSILFTMGESGDAKYLFYREGVFHEPAFVLHTDHLSFSGTGIIIARGSMNEMFSRSQIYYLKNGRIKEKKQPFYGINIHSQARKDFFIYETKRQKRAVTTIHKGENVSVLLAEFDEEYCYYLIQSVLGLTGWIRIEQGIWIDETPIKDLYFHGD